MRLEELVIPLKVDKSGFTGGLDSATKMLTNFAAVAAVAVAAAAVVVGKFIIDSTKLASDLAETVSKTNVVFEDMADATLKWGENAAKGLGISKNTALAAAATFGNLFRAMKIGTRVSASMSMSLVELAADLASFNNMNPTEVLDKLRAGLVGETEPLRSLGVNLNQAMLEAKALELGLWDGVDALDASAKAQAAFSIIMEQTALAQGDFARTSEGLANQQRILAAQWEDLKTTLGEKFLPIATKAIKGFNDLLSVLTDPDLDFNKFAAKLDNFVAKIIKGMGDSINNWASSGGPEALSESLISWIEGIGDENRVKSKLEIAMGHLATAIGNALANIDWSGIWAATDTKLDEIFIAGDEKIKVAVNNIDTTFNNWMLSLIQRHHTWANNLVDIYSSWAARVNLVVNTWVAGVIATYNAWSTNINNTVNNALANLKISIINKLTDIAKEFYNRAQGWVNQAIQGFQANKGRLLSEIGTIVTAINAILKKIITSFVLTFGINMGGLGGASGGAGGLGSSAPKNTTNTPHPGGGGRASGGPVIGGISYDVAEFFRPERFTPNTSGRIDAMGGTTVVALRREDINEFATVLARILPAELQKVRG